MRPGWLCELVFGAWCLILIHGTSSVVAEPCRAEQHPVYITKGRICCPKCEPRIPKDPCKHKMMECRCSQGFGCLSRSCTDCKEFPECKDGMISKTEVGSMYSYHCEKCPSGKVLDMESGLCKPGEMPSTTLPSPSTRNPTTEGDGRIANISDNYNYTWIFICVSVVFCLLLITVVIHLLIRTMKTAKSLKVQDLVPPHAHVPINMKEDGDTWSYQYPEEEHGDGAPSNKMSAF